MSTANSDSKSKAPRYHALDGARGVAALTVLLCHCMSRLHLSPGSRTESEVKAFLTLGHSSVIFFFVLSGFVLSIRFFGQQRVPFWRFQMGRIARLYPCLLITLLAALAVRLPGPDLEGYREIGGFALDARSSPTAIDLIRQALLLGIQPNDVSINGPTWSMIYELRAGLFIPIFCIALSRFNIWWSMISCGALFAASAYGLWMLHVSNPPFTGEGSILATAFVTLHYLVAFYIGCVTSRLCHDGRIDARSSLIVVAAALLLLPVGTALHSDLLLSLFAAAAIVAIRQSRMLTALLTAGPCAYLGRISYPLYLIHYTVLLGILRLSHGEISQPSFMILSLIASLSLATLIYRYVEIPSIALSKAINGARSRDTIMFRRAVLPP